MQTVVVFIAQYFLLLSVLGAAYVWIKLPTARAKKQFLVIAVVGAIATLALAKIGGMIFYDTRPFIVGNFTPWFGHSTDNGFPSDHTLLASFLGFVALRYSRNWGWALLALAFVIGMARVLSGVHHFIDIVGSFVIAGIMVWAVGWLVEEFYPAKLKAANESE